MFGKLFGSRPAPPPDYPVPSPEVPVEIVGDLHGCYDLLEALPPFQPGVIRIFVGDIVDRGIDTKRVVERVRAWTEEGIALCLMGNHEQMMLKFLENPVENKRWLRHGGLETCMSYGVAVKGSLQESNTAIEVGAALGTAVGAETEAWMRGLPKLWESGNLVVTHAGADPALPIELQEERVLMWGHPDYETQLRSDEKWVARGHIIVDEPSAFAGRISVDTGGYATGRLTMARIDPDGGIGFTTVT